MKFYTLKFFFSLLFAIVLVIPSLAQNNSLDFDGNDDEINCGTINLSGSALTIEAWVNPDAFQTNFPFISTIGGIEQSGNTALVRLGDASVANNRVQFVLQIGGSQQKLESIGTLSANTWTHIATTYDGAAMRIYINGVLDATRVQAGSVAGAGTFFIAQSFGGRWIDGQMDEFRVWNVARSGADISGSLNTELSGNETGLAAYYKFDDDGASCDVVDCSPNENHGTRTGLFGANNLPQFVPNIPAGITDVACGATLTNCVLSSPPASIPTMSEWGLILFALIMFSLSVVYGTQYQRRMALGQNMSSPASFSLHDTFNRGAFFKTLPLVYLAFAVLFVVAIGIFGYEMTGADIPGSLIAGAIIAYLIQFINQKA